MKLQVSDEQREFFQIHKSIEFEDLLTPQEIETLDLGISRLFSEKNTQEKFEASRDLFKKSDIIKKIAFLRSLSELAQQLQRQRPLRIAYDQYFPSPVQTPLLKPEKYLEFLKNSATLQEISSVQGLVCGALLTLSDYPKDPDNIFPNQRANVVFLHPNALLPLPSLLNQENVEYYLIVFANSKSHYLKNIKDPHSGSFIQTGYASGDKLTDKKNPIVFR